MDNNILNFSDSKKMKYKVNGEEFALKLLDYFEKSYQNGDKNIGVSSTHYYSHQQKLIILGLNHFNLKYPDLRVGIVSFSCDTGHFKEFKQNSTEIEKHAVYNYQGHFDLISWQHLLDTKQINTISTRYDVLIWEVPEIQFLSQNASALKEGLENLNALFIISNRLKSHDDAAFSKSISQYFLDHGVNISSILPQNLEKTAKKIRGKINLWARYFSKAD